MYRTAAVLILATLTFSPTLAHAEASPEQVVSKFITQAHAAIKLDSNDKQLHGDGGTPGFCQMVEEMVDVNYTITPVLKQSKQSPSPEKYAELLSAAKSFIVTQFAATFRGYNGDPSKIEFKVVAQSADAVSIKVFDPSTKVTSLVFVGKSDKGPRVRDLQYEGVNLVPLNQQQFVGVINKAVSGGNDGVQALIDILIRKSQAALGLCKN